MPIYTLKPTDSNGTGTTNHAHAYDASLDTYSVQVSGPTPDDSHYVLFDWGPIPGLPMTLGTARLYLDHEMSIVQQAQWDAFIEIKTWGATNDSVDTIGSSFSRTTSVFVLPNPGSIDLTRLAISLRGVAYPNSSFVHKVYNCWVEVEPLPPSVAGKKSAAASS